MTHLMRAYARRRWAQTVFSREGALNVCVRARGRRVRDGVSGGACKIRWRYGCLRARTRREKNTKTDVCAAALTIHSII